MSILSTHWDLIMTWKMFSGTARLYTVVFLICVGYASYSLARVLASPGKLREKASLTCDERRIESVRQTILLLLLLFGMTAANEAYRAFCGVPLSCPFRGDLDVVDGCGPWAIFTFTVSAGWLFCTRFSGLLQCGCSAVHQTLAAEVVS
jgi:hypothetical protein